LKPEQIQTDIQVGFSSIFWNTAWTLKQAPHTMGILCAPAHPALAHYPTGPYSDPQWASVMQHSRVMELDRLPGKVENLIQVVPDWFDPKPLSLAFETRIGNGRLLVTSIDFDKGIEGDPVLRQLAHSLEIYLAGPAFQPAHAIDTEALACLWK
jgi:hypothetical protein